MSYERKLAPDQPAANDPKYVVIELRARITKLLTDLADLHSSFMANEAIHKAEVAELEAENEALVETQRRKVVLLLGDRERAERALKQAEAELAALKCCGNCGNIHAYNAGTDDEFRECPYLREDDAEHDYLSIGCHYNPSRWAARARGRERP